MRAAPLAAAGFLTMCGVDLPDAAGVADVPLSAADAPAGEAPSGGDAGGASGEGGADTGLDPRAASETFSTCDGEPRFLYDPFGATLATWPDGALVRSDPSSPTGLRLDVSGAAWARALPGFVAPGFADLSDSSGFAASGDVLVRFTAPVALAPGRFTSSPGDAIRIVAMGSAAAAEPIPYALTIGDDARDVVLDPEGPLAAGARVAVLITSEIRATSGGCVGPAPAQVRARSDVGAPAHAVTEALTEAALGAGLGAGALVGGTVFVVHDDGPELSQRVAADRAGASWASEAACTVDAGVQVCDRAYIARDRRQAVGTGAEDTPAAWTVPVRAWLPAGRTGPVPAVVYGHGMGNDRSEGERAAQVLVPLGFAVIADDAVLHGAHPTAGPAVDGDPTLPFVGIDVGGTPRFVPASLRGHVLATAIGRVVLGQTLADSPDLDGDGIDDIDPRRIAYWGVSLGAIVGADVAALSPSYGAFVLTVGGGELVTFLTETEDLAAALPVFGLLVGGDAALARLLVAVQSVVDAADPATLGARVIADRFGDAGAAPSLLLQTAEHDDTVSPGSGRALARALGLAHVRPVATPVAGLVEAFAPLEANAVGGATAGYFQFDRVGVSVPVVATHGTTPFSPEALAQTTHFLETWRDTGRPEIIDPYSVLGTAPMVP